MFAKGDNSWRVQKFGTRAWHKPSAELIEICLEKQTRADLCVVGKTDMSTGQWFHLNEPKDDNWIKLDYESQREGQKLLTFGKPGRNR